MEQRSVIHFLWAKGLCPNAIHSEMRQVYGNKCFTRPAIHVWCKKFACGRQSVDKKDLACVLFQRLVQRTQQSHLLLQESLVWSDWRVSITIQLNLDDMLKNIILMFDI